MNKHVLVPQILKETGDYFERVQQRTVERRAEERNVSSLVLVGAALAAMRTCDVERVVV